MTDKATGGAMGSPLRQRMIDQMRIANLAKSTQHAYLFEVERLILATPDLHHRAAFVTAYGAGLRVSETVTVKIGDIKSDKKFLHIPSGKGAAERMAPLPDGGIHYRKRPNLAAYLPATPGPPHETTTLARCGESLLTLQADYREWFDNLPENLLVTSLGEKLQAIAELDLESLQDIDPPRGYGRD